MIKRTPLDAVFSDVVRESYDWTCARCEKPFPERKSREYQCSHFISRKYNSLRWYPDNACGLCGSCHHDVGSDPSLHTAFMQRILGPVRYQEVLFRKHQIYRYKAHDKKAMQAHYKGELERIKALRADGERGFIAVVAYD